MYHQRPTDRGGTVGPQPPNHCKARKKCTGTTILTVSCPASRSFVIDTMRTQGVKHGCINHVLSYRARNKYSRRMNMNQVRRMTIMHDLTRLMLAAGSIIVKGNKTTLKGRGLTMFMYRKKAISTVIHPKVLKVRSPKVLKLAVNPQGIEARSTGSLAIR